MGRVFVLDLEGRTYRCKFCKTHLALADDLVSRPLSPQITFALGEPRADGLDWLNSWTHLPHQVDYLHLKEKLNSSIKRNRVNITIGPNEERMMLSGMHTVADIYCCCCGQIVGWKYEAAHEKSQKYKEEKFVLERGRIVDGLDSEFYIDTHASMSDDAEDA